MADLDHALLHDAVTLLKKRAYSAAELRKKLSDRSNRADAEAVLLKLEELHLVDDQVYAYNFAVSRLGHRGWGPVRIRSELRRRSVPSAIIDAALERACPAPVLEQSLKQSLERFCSQRGTPQDLRGVRRLVQHLQRKGFGPHEIRPMLRSILAAVVWQRFEEEG